MFTRSVAGGNLVCGLVIGLAAACDEPSPPSDGISAWAPPETTMIPMPAPPRLVAADSLPPRIFFDLTRYEWYAHREPLLWDHLEWQPGDAPVALRTQEMTHVGEYQGVDLYVRTADDSAGSVDAVYVPVSEGFWLPFEPTRREVP